MIKDKRRYSTSIYLFLLYFTGNSNIKWHFCGSIYIYQELKLELFSRKCTNFVLGSTTIGTSAKLEFQKVEMKMS